MPTVALEAAETVLRREVGEGRIRPGHYIENRERNRRLAAMAAEMFGAGEDEIALTHSAGEGLNAALGGISWNQGDEVVTTNEEHPGLLMPLRRPGARSSDAPATTFSYRRARLTAETTARSDAVTMFGSMPTPHRTRSPTAHST